MRPQFHLLTNSLKKLILIKNVSEEVKAKIEKVGRIIIYVFFAIVAILLLIILLNALEVQTISSAIEGNAFLNKLFNNRYMGEINDIIKNVFVSDNLFGFDINGSYNNIIGAYYTYTTSFPFQILQEGGIFAFIFLVAFLALTIITSYKYLFKSTDNIVIKSLTLSFAITFIFVSSFSYDSTPLIHESTPNVVSLFSLIKEPTFLMFVFFVGYMLTSEHPKKEENEANQKVEEKPKEEIENEKQV